MATYELKTWPPHYIDVEMGFKTVEIRHNDRDYLPGDTLILREWDPRARWVDSNQVEQIGTFTGRACVRYVTHVLKGGQFGLSAGYVALSISEKPPWENAEDGA